MSRPKSLVIFLGAGAACADGAPTQAKLFHDFFDRMRQEEAARTRHFNWTETDSELRTFFHLLFRLNVDSSAIQHSSFPTFEEALGMIDLAELRSESFPDFDLDTLASNSDRLRFMRHRLVMLMGKVLDDALEKTASPTHHEILIRSLKKHRLLERTTFITTNYDLLLDNALNQSPDFNDVGCNYKIDAVDFESSNEVTYSTESRPLLKIHGSLNWLYCQTCKQVQITPREKGAMRLLERFTGCQCRACESVPIPLVVPPSFFKNMSRETLERIWCTAERELLEADTVVFSGYSFPDADLHIKYLLKRAQSRRQKSSLDTRYVVLNHFKEKDKNDSKTEKLRYERFLGGHIEFLRKGFVDLARNPQKIVAT
jgi:NAD-dependent SIR2 family protein deacetylase